MAQHTYPARIVTQDDRDLYDEGFDDGEYDVCDGGFPKGAPRGEEGDAYWIGYRAGVKNLEDSRPNWEAQAAYDARWNSLPDMPEA